MRAFIVVCGVIIMGIIAYSWTMALDEVVVGTHRPAIPSVSEYPALSGGRGESWDGLSPEAAAEARGKINTKYGVWLMVALAGTVGLVMVVPANSNTVNSNIKDSENKSEEVDEKKADNDEGIKVVHDQADEEIQVLKDQIASMEKTMTAILSDQATKEADYKECPYCMEKVKKTARLCRYCRSELSNSN